MSTPPLPLPPHVVLEADFFARHPGPRVVLDRVIHLFPDGAQIRAGPLAAFFEPPAERRDSLLARRRYHVTLLAALLAEQAKLRAALSDSLHSAGYRWPGSGDGPHADWLAAHLGPAPVDAGGRPDGAGAMARLTDLVERERQTVLPPQSASAVRPRPAGCGRYLRPPGEAMLRKPGHH